MDTHPRSAADAEDTRTAIASGDLAAVARTIDPILLGMIEGVQKGSLGAVELVDIAVRIRTILQDAVRRSGATGSVGSNAATGATAGAGTTGASRAAVPDREDASVGT